MLRPSLQTGLFFPPKMKCKGNNMRTVQKLPAIDLPRERFDGLCIWIDLHLDEPIGWQQLFDHSGLDYQTLQALFYKHAAMTPMTWIRNRRLEKSVDNAKGRPILTLKKKNQGA